MTFNMNNADLLPNFLRSQAAFSNKTKGRPKFTSTVAIARLSRRYISEIVKGLRYHRFDGYLLLTIFTSVKQIHPNLFFRRAIF
jgi:hypothetical protein